jgi:hypothetical protein
MFPKYIVMNFWSWRIWICMALYKYIFVYDKKNLIGTQYMIYERKSKMNAKKMFKKISQNWYGLLNV